MTRRALMYCRQSKSNVDDGDESVSVQAQQRRIATFAERNELTIFDDAFYDVDVRGTTVQRDGLDALLERVEQGGIDAVVVYDVSRLSRDTELFVNLLNRLKRHNVELISTREPAGERWLQILFSSLAERDRGLLSVRVADAMRERANAGQYVGQVPLGYTREKVDDNGRTIRKLKPDQFAPLIAEVFARYDGGESVIGLARWLNEPGHPLPKRAKRWSGPTVNWMLRNAAYAGDVVVKKRGSYPAVTVRDAHPAIVDRECFDRVQRRLDGAGSRDTPRLRKTNRHWLEGRVFCACGAPMYLIERRHTEKGHLMREWICRRKNANRSLTSANGVCDRTRGSVGNRRVEPVVLRLFAADMARIADTRPDSLAARADKPDTMRDHLRTRLTQVQSERRNLATSISRAIDPTYLIDRDNALAAEEASLIDQLASVPVLMTVKRLQVAVDAATEIAGIVALAGASNDQDKLQAIAGRVGVRVTVDGDSYGVVVGYDDPWDRLV